MSDFTNVFSLFTVATISLLMFVSVLLTEREWVNDWRGTAMQLGLIRKHNGLSGTYRGRTITIIIDPGAGESGSTIIQMVLKLPPKWAFDLRPAALAVLSRMMPADIFFDGAIRVNQCFPSQIVEEIFADTALRQCLLNQAAGLQYLMLNHASLEYSYESINSKRIEEACDLLCDIADALEQHIF